MVQTHSQKAQHLLLETKISIPLLPPDTIQRTRLTELIDIGVLGPLTLIVAPTGFGKTHLLIEWIHQTHLPVGWLSISHDDNDFFRFINYFIGALHAIQPGLGQEAIDMFQSAKGSRSELGMTLLINEIVEVSDQMVLVLDDFQTIENQSILRSLEFLIKHLPPNLHLIIASRKEPELDLHGLRAKGKVFDLRANDLRFIGDEVADFINTTLRKQVPPETIQSLERQTEGWIAALQLAALSLRHQPDKEILLGNFQGNSHYLVDYLASEVLHQQKEEIQQFLIKSSVLDALTGPLCEAVVKPQAQPGYGMFMLNRLEQANLFIHALDEKHEWFRYHQLFAGFLRHIQMETNPNETSILNKRAALWYEKQQNLPEAFHYAHASGDAAWMAELMERNIFAMIASGEITSLAYWCGKLPDEVIRQRPVLCLSYAWVLIAAYQLDQAQNWIDYLLRIYQPDQIPSDDGQLSTDPFPGAQLQDLDLWNIQGGLELCQSTLAIYNGDMEQAEKHTKQATRYLNQENPFIQSLLLLEESVHILLSGNTQKAINALKHTIKIARQANNLYVLIIATCYLAEMQMLQGQMDLAWATLTKAQALSTSPEGNPLPLALRVNLVIGKILYARNQLDESNSYLEVFQTNAQHLHSFGNQNDLVMIAHIKQAQGDDSGAFAIINDAFQLALSTDTSQWDDAVVCATAVRMALRRGDLETAERWWMKGGFPAPTQTIPLENFPYHIYEQLLLTQARYLIELGQQHHQTDLLQQSLRLLEMLHYEAERLQRLTSQIEILLLQSKALQAIENDEQALHALLEALALGEPAGFLRLYLDEGPSLTDLLLQCLIAQENSNHGLPSSDFITQLIETIQAEANLLEQTPARNRQAQVTLRKKGQPQANLSQREIQVLQLIAKGMTNQEISDQLCIAVNTVKRHASNIYQNLHVNNRTQAVIKARHLGLIP